MRTIKFRAWDKKNRKMFGVSGYFMDSKIKKRKYILERYGGSEENDITINLPFDELELMQFTGLLDKNGKEIYEGDIVIDMTPYQTETKGEVKYMDMGFKIDDEYGTPMHSFSENYEVIGNIYENKDLV